MKCHDSLFVQEVPVLGHIVDLFGDGGSPEVPDELPESFFELGTELFSRGSLLPLQLLSRRLRLSDLLELLVGNFGRFLPYRLVGALPHPDTEEKESIIKGCPVSLLEKTIPVGSECLDNLIKVDHFEDDLGHAACHSLVSKTDASCRKKEDEKSLLKSVWVLLSRAGQQH